MLGKLAPLKPLVMGKKKPGPITDSPIFRLHCSFTVAVLAAAALLVSGSNWFGGAIHCSYDMDHFSHDYIEALCWANGTYYHPDGANHHYREAAPFIRPGGGFWRKSDHSEGIRQVLYYQWVAFTLSLQALLCYVPRWVWKEFEGGLMERLAEGHLSLATYMLQNSSANKRYMTAYFLAEFMSLINLVGQMLLLDCLFGGEFWDYGVEVLSYVQGNFHGYNPMLRLFPRLTKCSTQAYSLNGNVLPIEVLCVLPLNVVNEKIFLFLWFWFVFLSILSTALILYRLTIFSSPAIRMQLLSCRLNFLDHRVVHSIFKKLSIGDWFILYTLAPHVDYGMMSRALFEMNRRTTFEPEFIVEDSKAAGNLKSEPPFAAGEDGKGREDDKYRSDPTGGKRDQAPVKL